MGLTFAPSSAVALATAEGGGPVREDVCGEQLRPPHRVGLRQRLDVVAEAPNVALQLAERRLIDQAARWHAACGLQVTNCSHDDGAVVLAAEEVLQRGAQLCFLSQHAWQPRCDCFECHRAGRFF